MDLDDVSEMYRSMVRVRLFERAAGDLYRSGDIPGFVHLSIGQEASAVGATWPLRPTDVITSTHRGHGHCLAKGLEPEQMIAELLARQSGSNRGFGGSMHIADPGLGIYGANGIVAAGLPIAVGAANAARLRRDDTIVVAMFGDGAVAQGAFHEAANLASLWALPVIFFCENNGYAEFARTSDQHPVDLSARANGYGLPFHRVDGDDVVAVAELMDEIVTVTRAGDGPALVEAVTHRWEGHYVGDPERYRDDDEREGLAASDPLERCRNRLLDHGVPESTLTAIEDEEQARLNRGIEAANDDDPPSTSLVDGALRAPTPSAQRREDPPSDDAVDQAPIRVMDAIRLALEHELESTADVFLAGVDVGQGGNVFGLTRHLHPRWPERVLDTPISETAIMGLGVGGSLAGLRPVVEIMYLDFIGVCFDQLLNQAAKLRFMTGGRAQLPLVVRTQFGAGRSSGSQHSQSLEALLAHIPGLTVVMPSTPADTYGLLRAAIRDPNPVIVIENRLLYGRKGPAPRTGHIVPIGQAAVRRPGSDITLVSVSRMVDDALAAADAVAAEGIDVEVIDLRTVAPLDLETVLASVRRTTRLVIAHEAVTDFGIGAEIAARIGADGFWHLDAPIARVGAAPTPAPYAPQLERAWLPSVDRIVHALWETVGS